MQGRRSDNSNNDERGSTNLDSLIGMVLNVKCAVCEKEISPYPLSSPPSDMLQIDVAPARNISNNHGLNRRKFVCGDCANAVLEGLNIDNFDWGNR